MSKIQKALEKAKKDRRESGDTEGVLSGHKPSFVKAQALAFEDAKLISLEKGHLEENRLMVLLDNPEVTDHYNLLRTQILWRTRPAGHNTIMVTSALDGEGKTVTAIHLAVSIARDVKHSVLLVDTDLRNPKIHTYLGGNMQKGLADHILHDTPLSELVVNPGIAKMRVLPAGKALLGSTELLGSPKMEKLVEELKGLDPEQYIIFDSPPVLAVPDALVFSSYVDVVLVVVEAGKTGRDQIRKTVELLEGRNILGLVMNKAKELDRGYGYYGYYYKKRPDTPSAPGSSA